MSTAVKLETRDARSIPFQEASLDIWDKKYRLTAKDGDAHRRDDGRHLQARRARAGRRREGRAVREHWYEQFLWALRRGAIPAGRITSNAGAQEHKPATSTINCTVSGHHPRLDGRHPRQGARGRPHAEGRLRHRLRILDAAPARRVRVGRRRVHVGPAVVHGYLRQDVLHRVVGRRPPRRADGHLRRRPSRTPWNSSAPSARTAACASSTCRCSITDEFMQAVREDTRLAAGLPGARRRRSSGEDDSTIATQVHLARVADARELRRATTRAWSPARSTRRCRRGACGT